RASHTEAVAAAPEQGVEIASEEERAPATKTTLPEDRRVAALNRMRSDDHASAVAAGTAMETGAQPESGRETPTGEGWSFNPLQGNVDIGLRPGGNAIALPSGASRTSGESGAPG